MKLWNIGLKWNDGSGRQWFPAEVLEMLGHHGIKVLEHEVAESDTEQTLIVLTGEGNVTDRNVDHLCKRLHQDCVAISAPLGTQGPDVLHADGRLVGPKAASWGTFDPRRFILPSSRIFWRAVNKLTQRPRTA